MTKASTTTVQTFSVWALSYLFFLFTLAKNLSASHDSINYLLHISAADHLFHQHHLLYHFAAHLWSGLFSFIGADEYLIIESFTAVWGSGVMAVCYALLRNRFRIDHATALASVALILFCYGPWFYSVNIEVYMPPLFFLLAGFYRMSRPVTGVNNVVFVALLHTAAILFHQANILIVPVALYWILKNYKPRAHPVALYLAIVILATAAVYVFAGIYGEEKNTFDDLQKWVLGYTVGHDYWQPLSWQTPFRAAAGFFRAIIGGQFMFQLPPVKQFFESFFSGHSLEDEAFLTAQLPLKVAWMLFILSIFTGVALVILAFRFIFFYRKLGERQRLIQPMLMAGTIYSLFFLFWMPEILEFWIFQVVIFLLIVTGTVGNTGSIFRLKPFKAIALLAIVVFVINYTGSIHWLRSFKYDWYYQKTQQLQAVPGDLVIVQDRWILKDYVRYFRHAEVMSPDEEYWSPDEVRRKIVEVRSKGGRVFINSEGPAGEMRWRIIQSY